MIGILAVLVALIAIISKVVNNIRYLNLLPESTDPTDFIGAMSPIFLSNKEEEQENDKLKKIAKRIRINLWIFYLSIVVFFGYVSF